MQIPSIRQQAQDGLRRMEGDNRASRREGDVWLGTIAASATGTERLVAETMRAAAAQCGKDASAARAQRVTLQALAAGLAGAGGPALAHVALQVLEAVDRPKDACAMAESILATLDGGGARSGDQILAETVKIAGTNCLDKAAAREIFKDGLRALASDRHERTEVALARFGLAARQHAMGADARAMGQISFQQIERYTADADVRARAHRAFEDSIPARGDLWGASGSGIGAMQERQLEAIVADGARRDEEEARRTLDQLQRMAAEQPASAPGSVEIHDGSVVIGGVRVDVRR